MMKQLFAGIVFVILVSISTDAQIVARNLLQNGSFEYTGRDTIRARPDESWTFTTEYETVTGHATRSRAIDGFRSYLIRAEEGGGNLESDPFNIERRTYYRFSFGVCGDGMVTTKIIWWQQEGDSLTVLDKEHLDTMRVMDDWSVPHFEIRSPRRASAASVRFSVFDGQAWIDDVRFR